MIRQGWKRRGEIEVDYTAEEVVQKVVRTKEKDI